MEDAKYWIDGIGGCKILEHFTEIQTRHLFLNYLCDFLKNQIKGQMFSSFQYGCSVSENEKMKMKTIMIIISLLWVIDDCWVFVTFMREEREAASGALLLELLFKLLPTKNVI